MKKPIFKEVKERKRMKEYKEKGYSDLKQALDEYKSRYRRADLPEIEEYGFYALPKAEDKTAPDGKKAKYKWPNEWPGIGKRGYVYAFFDERQLLYIGQTNDIERRMVAYFRKRYMMGLVRIWKHRRLYERLYPSKPLFVKIFSTDDKVWFETLAIEAFLIEELQPKGNVQGA